MARADFFSARHNPKVKDEIDSSETFEDEVEKDEEDYSQDNTAKEVDLDNVRDIDKELFTFVSTDNASESETQVETEENVIDKKVLNMKSKKTIQKSFWNVNIAVNPSKYLNS